MAVPHIPRLRQRGRLELHDLPSGSLSATGDVSALADQLRIMEKIIRSAVLLEDHHYVLNLSRRRRGRWRTAAGTAAAVEAHERAPRGQHHDCEYQDAKLHGGRHLAGVMLSWMRTRASSQPQFTIVMDFGGVSPSSGAP